MRKVSLLGLLLWSAIASAQTTVFNATLGEARAGTSTFAQKEDGSFSGTVELTFGNLRIANVLEGKFEEGRVDRYTSRFDNPQGKVNLTFDRGKLVVEQGTNKVERTLENWPKPAFANYFPTMAQSVFAAYDRAKGGSQTISFFLLDSGVPFTADVRLRGRRPVEVKSGRKVVDEWDLKIGPTTLQYAAEPDGRVVGMNVPLQMFQMVAEGFEGLFVDPSTLDKRLSQPTSDIQIDKRVRMKMRDGVELVAEVIRPAGEGKHPTILTRTPYGRELQVVSGLAEWWARRGYAVVVQDVRGRHDSQGVFDPFMTGRKDGYDTIDWIAKQPWSDGKVGMIGASYAGMVQWQAAVENHPALKAIIPQVSPPDPFFNIPYDFGVFFLYGAVWWSNVVKDQATSLEGIGQPVGFDKLGALPLTKVDDEALGRDVPFFDEWLRRERHRDWRAGNYQDDLRRVTIPALHISGWWDGDGIGTKTNWERMARLGRKNQWLIYGPWSHAFNSSSVYGDLDYGPTAILDLQTLYLRWFDTWLKGKEAGLNDVPKVRVFVTGANEWRDLRGWPDPASREQSLYLSAPRPAHGKDTGGELVPAPPRRQDPSRFTFDPNGLSVPQEMRDPLTPATTRIDLGQFGDSALVYRSAPMEKPMDIGGPISVDVHFSTDARDCDLFVAVVDIAPDGTARMIGLPGKMRMRYLSGWDNPRPLTPNRVYTATLHHWDFAHRFATGHRIGLVINGGWHPVWARNTGTGEPIATGTRLVKQTQTIYHDAARPSRLRFHVLPQ